MEKVTVREVLLCSVAAVTSLFNKSVFLCLWPLTEL